MNNFIYGLMGMGLCNFIRHDADKGAGGGAGGGNDSGGQDKSVADQIKEMRGLIDAQANTIKELSAKAPDKKKEDLTLNDQVEADRKSKELKDGDQKALESALTFTLTSKDFLKENSSILPKEMEELFRVADKEKFDSPIQKSNAIKAGIIQSFFSLQANIEHLTPTHKQTLEDYFKLTKNGKEERAQNVYENIFEPALEVLKRIKKAEEVTRSRNGFGNSSDTDKAYKEKLIAGSKKHYLNVKGE